MQTIAADLLLVVHFGIAASIVLGLCALWLGGLLDWHWTRRRPLRWLHATAIGVVAVQSALGIRCPLTLWEDALRGMPTESSFVQRWVGRLLYYDLPEIMFTAAYLAAVAVTLLAWWIFPPISATCRRQHDKTFTRLPAHSNGTATSERSTA